MKKTNPKVDEILSRATKWLEELETLRTIILGFPLNEELKWYQPCYTLENKNVVLIHGFKEYCALMFFKGSLLKDPKQILVSPGEHTQVTRQIRFRNVREIVALKSTVKAYIQEAIEVEKTGLKVTLKKTSDFKIPVEFQNKLEEIPALKTAFCALTPGRQRAYILHFSQPKQSKTREARVEKYIRQILSGKGINDE